MRNMARWRRLKTFPYSAMYIGREYRQLNSRDKRGVMRNMARWKRLKTFPYSALYI
jgi:hypothetical protein